MALVSVASLQVVEQVAAWQEAVELKVEEDKVAAVVVELVGVVRKHLVGVGLNIQFE